MKQALILLIEDNLKILSANKRVFEGEGYQVETAETLKEARQALTAVTPDVIVLDLMLPDGNGLELIGEIRAVTAAPLLILTSLRGKEDYLKGLRVGGDDYITKPYDIDVLVARVEAFLRRESMHRESSVPQQLFCEPLRLDLVTRQAFLNGKNMMISPKEFALLLILLRNKGQIVETETLYTQVWQQPMMGDSSALWKQVSRLKKKLEDGGGAVEIFSIRGFGYQLEIM